MGANVSTQIQDIKTLIENNLSVSCQNVSDTTQTIKGLNISIEGADCGNIVLQNKARVQQECNMDQVSSALAEASMSATAEQTAGLGLFPNVSTTVQERQTIIKNRLEAKCGSTAAVKQSIEDVNFTFKPWCSSGGLFSKKVCFPAKCDSVQFLNDAGTVQQCVAAQVAEAQDKMTQAAESKQTNSIFAFGIGGIAIVVVIIVIVMMVSGKKKNGDGSGASALAAAQAKNGANGAAAGNKGQGALGFAQGALNLYNGNKGKGSIINSASGFLKKKGGARRGTSLFTKGTPMVVLIIMAIVMYVKSRENPADSRR